LNFYTFLPDGTVGENLASISMTRKVAR